MNQIALNKRGAVAQVDEDMLPYLSQWKWRTNGDGYAVRHVEWAGFIHRIKMEWQVMYGPSARTNSPNELYPPVGLVIDHANGNRSDNRRANLRTATAAQNTTNAQRHNPRKRSRYLGVQKNWKGGYLGKVRYQNIGHFTGLCATEEEAARARDELLFSLAGEFGVYNFPVAALGDRCRLWRGTKGQLSQRD